MTFRVAFNCRDCRHCRLGFVVVHLCYDVRLCDGLAAIRVLNRILIVTFLCADYLGGLRPEPHVKVAAAQGQRRRQHKYFAKPFHQSSFVAVRGRHPPRSRFHSQPRPLELQLNLRLS